MVDDVEVADMMEVVVGGCTDGGGSERLVDG